MNNQKNIDNGDRSWKVHYTTRNYWRTASLILLILVIVFLASTYIQEKKIKSIEVQDDYSVLNNLDFLSKVNDPSYFITICNKFTGECEVLE